MLRVSAASEKAGIPSVTLVCEGFAKQAQATSRGLGLPGLPLSVLPGHTGTQSPDVVRANVRVQSVQQVIDGLVNVVDQTDESDDLNPREIAFSGSFEEVNEFFYEKSWSDGLPIVPPTKEKVEEFLRYTDRSPFETMGVMLPDSRRATPWNVAINGVMAGCLPQYMPILMAIVEAMLDPEYGLEHSGNTPGSEAVILLNGPLIKTLGFNYEQGVMRDGIRPNTSIGRFLRLYLRNVAGFLHGTTDKGTYGNTWRVVIAENEDELMHLGWTSHAMDMGFTREDSVVTIARYTGGNVLASVAGTTPQELMPYITDRMLKEHGFHVTFTVGSGLGALRPLLLLSPVLARTIAAAGWSKQDVQRHLFENARMSAHLFELYATHWTDQGHALLADRVAKGDAPKELFHASDDPERLVPIVFRPEDFFVVVTGDPLRTNAYIFTHNGLRGFPVARKVKLPKDWDRLIANASAGIAR